MAKYDDIQSQLMPVQNVIREKEMGSPGRGEPKANDETWADPDVIMRNPASPKFTPGESFGDFFQRYVDFMEKFLGRPFGGDSEMQGAAELAAEAWKRAGQTPPDMGSSSSSSSSNRGQMGKVTPYYMTDTKQHGTHEPAFDPHNFDRESFYNESPTKNRDDIETLMRITKDPRVIDEMLRGKQGLRPRNEIDQFPEDIGSMMEQLDEDKNPQWRKKNDELKNKSEKDFQDSQRRRRKP